MVDKAWKRFYADYIATEDEIAKWTVKGTARQKSGAKRDDHFAVAEGQLRIVKGRDAWN